MRCIVAITQLGPSTGFHHAVGTPLYFLYLLVGQKAAHGIESDCVGSTDRSLMVFNFDSVRLKSIWMAAMTSDLNLISLK